MDTTPTDENGVIMTDPYELFSTPPSDMILSSTPSKQPNQGAGGARKGKANRQPIGSARKTLSADASTTRVKKPASTRRQKSANLWDKCLEKNPELAEFVDHFNESLAEACSKPLDIISQP